MSGDADRPSRGVSGRVRGRASLGAAILVAVAYLGGGGWNLARRDYPALCPEQAQLRLDPNSATRAELMLLPEIGPKLADQIVAYRQRSTPSAFARAEDLAHVRGIGPATVERLRPFLRFDERRASGRTP